MEHRLIKAANEAAQMAKDHTMTKLTEAQITAPKEADTKPERIWVDWPNPDSAGLAFSCQKRPPARRTEYVRADLVDALLAENAKLREALRLAQAMATKNIDAHDRKSADRHCDWQQFTHAFRAMMNDREARARKAPGDDNG